MTSSYNVDLVMDGATFLKIRERSEETEFLLYWLVEKGIKIVVPIKGWNEYFKDLKNAFGGEKKAEESDNYKGISASVRGISTPYRLKYGIEAGLDIDQENDEEDSGDEILIIKSIVNRHYATVSYLIVKDTAPYKKLETDLKIQTDRITTLRDFFSIMTVHNRFYY